MGLSNILEQMIADEELNEGILGAVGRGLKKVAREPFRQVAKYGQKSKLYKKIAPIVYKGKKQRDIWGDQGINIEITDKERGDTVSAVNNLAKSLENSPKGMELLKKFIAQLKKMGVKK